MSGFPENNYPAFKRASAELRALGLKIVSPAESMPHPGEATHEQYLALLTHDVCIMVSLCRGLILLPGWHKSRGARLEISIALALEWPIRFWTGSDLVDMDTPVVSTATREA